MKKIILMNSSYILKAKWTKKFSYWKKDKNQCGHENGIPEGSFQKMSADKVSIWMQKGQKLGWNFDFNIKDWMHEILFSIEIVFEN